MHEVEFLKHMTTSLSQVADGTDLSDEIWNLEDMAQRVSELRLVAAIEWGVVRAAWGMDPSRPSVLTLDDPDAQRALADWMEASSNLEKVQSELRNGFLLVLTALTERSGSGDED